MHCSPEMCKRSSLSAWWRVNLHLNQTEITSLQKIPLQKPTCKLVFFRQETFWRSPWSCPLPWKGSWAAWLTLLAGKWDIVTAPEKMARAVPRPVFAGWNHPAAALILGRLLQLSWAPIQPSLVYLMRRCWTGTRGRNGAVPALPGHPEHSRAAPAPAPHPLHPSHVGTAQTTWASAPQGNKHSISILESFNSRFSEPLLLPNQLPVKFLTNNRVFFSCISFLLLS